MVTAAFIALATACAPAVDVRTTSALVAVESTFNPFAIGVVGGVLDRQPHRRAEAIATARQLQAEGLDFSVGLAQINARNFKRLGLTVEAAVDPCMNLAAMQEVLAGCFDRASHRQGDPQRSLRQALSCYYSGNVTTGFDHGYVRRILHAADRLTSRPVSRSSEQKE